MFSGAIRWFHQHVLPSLSNDVSTFFKPLLLDVGTVLETVSLDMVKNVVGGLNATGKFDPSKLIQVSVDELKALATSKLLPAAEHALVGLVTAEVANIHAVSAGAAVAPVAATVAEVTAAGKVQPDPVDPQPGAAAVSALSALGTK